MVDGYVTVPISVAASGAGQTVLRNLEVRYRPLTAVAGFAEPPLFSPSASPGTLDSTVLSMLGSGAIAVLDAAGQLVRTLIPDPAGSRWAAVFDGRDGGGAVLPSGVYRFGPPGGPVAQVEIDDIPPEAVLDPAADGSFGGLATVTGRATDRDYAGSSKNFARFVLEYTLDDVHYTRIATATSPSSGVLARWDTRALPVGPVSLRLTVYDLAGNSAVATRAVSVSPNAPQPPIIDAPTVAGAPRDSLAPAVAVAGSAERGTVVTVYVNGTPVGTVPSNGRWSLGSVALPEGISSVSAEATRGGLTSLRARPIIVGRYALALAVHAPSRVEPGARFDAQVMLQRVSVGSGPVKVRVWTTDLIGQPSALLALPIEQVVQPDAAGDASFAVTLDTQGLLPGRYQLHAQVVEGGLVPADAAAEVLVDPAVGLRVSLASDRATYDELQAVVLTARIVNAGAQVIGPLVANLAVTGPDGRVTGVGPFAVPPIPVGQYVELSSVDAAVPHLAGSYTAEINAADGAGVLSASGATSYAVASATGSDAIAGTLTVNPTSYLPGDTLQASYTLTNRGAGTVVPTELLLLTRASGALVARWQGATSVPSLGTASGTASLGTASADGRPLDAVLLGRGRVLAVQGVEAAPPRDTTPPAIAMSGFTDGEVRAGAVTPMVVITDESRFTSTVTLSGLPFASGTEVAEEGDYVLAAAAEDAYGNTAALSRTFAVDRTPPTIAVSGVSDGALRNAAVTPVVNVTDPHLGQVDTRLDGSSFESGSAVGDEGDHVLSVSANDRAGNEARIAVRFTLDLSPPVVTVSGVAEGATYPGQVSASWTVNDAHPGSTTATLDGQPYQTGAIIGAAGTHLLVVTARDLAGNETVVQRSFTVDGSAVDVGLQIRSDASPRVLVFAYCPQGYSPPTAAGTDGRGALAVISAGRQVRGSRIMETATCPAFTVSLLTSTLKAAGIRHDLVFDLWTLQRLLRNQHYGVVLLYRSPEDEGNVTGYAALEFFERSFSGLGLVLVNSAPIDSLLTGSSPPRPDGIVQLSGVEVGRRVAYGRGRLVTLDFNPEVRGDDPAFRDVLVQSVRYASTGEAPPLVPRQPVLLEVVDSLRSPGALESSITVSLPTGVELRDIDWPVTLSGSTLTWVLTLHRDAPLSRRLMVAPMQAGEFTIPADLYPLGQPTAVASASHVLRVPSSAEEILAAAIDAVSLVPSSGGDATLRADALAKLASVTLVRTDEATALMTIDAVLGAIADVLAMSSPEAASAREPLDVLLRAVELIAVSNAP